MPYRDFELLVPPGYPYLLRAVVGVVGEQFVVLRAIGAMQMGLIAVCVFYLVLRFATKAMSGLIAVSVTTYLTSSTAFFGYDYVYTALLFMLATLCYCIRLETENARLTRESSWRWILLGATAAGATLIKQTQGLWTIIGLVLLLLIFNWSQWHALFSKMALSILGVVAVWTPLVIWFAVNGVSPIELARAIYVVDGPKGSLLKIVFGWVSDIFSYNGQTGIRAAAASALAISRILAPWVGVAVILRWISDSQEANSTAKRLSIGSLIILAVISSVIPWERLGFVDDLLTFFGEQFRSNVFVGSWFAVIFFGVWTVCSKPERHRSKAVLSTVVCVISVVWACGMSAGLTENGVFLPAAVAIAMFLYFTREFWVAILLAGLVMVSVLSGSWWVKQANPYSWWGYQTPSVSEATSQYEKGLMRGLWTSPGIRNAYEQIQTYGAATSKCNGDVIAYPHIPVTLLDLGLTPGGRLAQYWYDFSSASEIQQEIDRLETQYLSALIILALPSSVIEGHEVLFNRGDPLIHRQLLSRLQEHATDMTQVVDFEISPDVRLQMYVNSCVRAVLEA